MLLSFFPVGVTQTKTHFYSFLKDSKIKNAATTDKHMDRLIKILKNKNALKDTLYETTDGCGAQYRSATVLWFLSLFHSLIASGGALCPIKSFCYLIDFHWNGKDFEYRTKDNMPGSFTLIDKHGNRETLKRLEVWQAQKTL
jgi:hypothetical protein